MPLDIGTGLKLLDYVVKYAKPLRRGLDFVFRDDPINLKLEVPPRQPPRIYSQRTSDLIAFVVIDQRKIIYISSANVGWNDRIVTLEFNVDAESDKLLGALSHKDNVVVAHWYKAVMCECVSKDRYISGHKVWFKFTFDIVESDFTLGLIEHASRPKHFRERARRLLFELTAGPLPPVPAEFGQNSQVTVHYLNTVFRELQFEGKAQIVESQLPDLYARFGKEPDRFLQIAWIQLAMDLQTTDIVTVLNGLELELEGSRLYINLRAKRHEDDMSMEGYCELAAARGAAS